MGWKIALNERAESDLEQVVTFLARKNPEAARRLGLELVETIFSLAQLPHRGVAIRSRPGYRRILQRPWFLIFYRIIDAPQRVEIVRIWDARQNPAALELE
jgi:plasmid stabilization system protein ParE